MVVVAVVIVENMRVEVAEGIDFVMSLHQVAHMNHLGQDTHNLNCSPFVGQMGCFVQVWNWILVDSCTKSIVQEVGGEEGFGDYYFVDMFLEVVVVVASLAQSFDTSKKPSLLHTLYH